MSRKRLFCFASLYGCLLGITMTSGCSTAKKKVDDSPKNIPAVTKTNPPSEKKTTQAAPPIFLGASSSGRSI